MFVLLLQSASRQASIAFITLKNILLDDLINIFTKSLRRVRVNWVSDCVQQIRGILILQRSTSTRRRNGTNYTSTGKLPLLISDFLFNILQQYIAQNGGRMSYKSSQERIDSLVSG